MKTFDRSRWIWIHDRHEKDEYAEFEDVFIPVRGAVTVRLSCDSDYTLWVNGTYAASGQYGDFEHYKVYDTVDITPYLTEGANRLSILVWHFGNSSQRYYPAPAGLIYEIYDESGLLSASTGKTLARKSPTYQSGRKKNITGQLGYGFRYDASKEDGWPAEPATGFSPAVTVEKRCSFHPRPIKKHALRPISEGKAIRGEEHRILFDLGKECVGLLSLDLFSQQEQNVRISFGEHLADDGWIPRKIGSRDFSVEYGAKTGKNEYTNYMLRLGCRYLEVESEVPLKECSAGIIDQVYPVKRIPARFERESDRRIYEMCVNTLEKCMMEHYVDCPWREQNLYAFDSRNQMLCGYRVFEGGNAEYARANLLLFAQDRRDDRLLSICTPCGADLTIPSFSLYYALAVREYVAATGDLTLIPLVVSKITELLKTFLDNRTGELVMRFEGKNHWNFYDWTPYSAGSLGQEQAAEADAALNGILILSLDSLEEICRAGRISFPYPGEADRLRAAVKKTFFDKKADLITMRSGAEEYTELINSLAILAGIVSGEEAETVCRKIADKSLVPCSLSMRIFKYEALLRTDRERYLPLILEEIRRDYKVMLDAGSDCAWETILGAEDFDNAGSLCHGWSAVPVLYLPQIKE